MGSSRKLPLSYNTSTYDSAGGKTYTALGTWESATDNDLTTAEAGEVLDCYKGNHTDVMGSFYGAVTSADYFRVVRPANGEGHSGIPLFDGSIVSFNNATYSYLIRVYEDYSQLHDLVGTQAYNAAGTIYIFACHNDRHYGKLIGCLAANGVNPGAGSCDGLLFYDAHYIINCLSYNNEGDGALSGGNADAFFYNCTIKDNGVYGYHHIGAGDTLAKNLICEGNVSGQFIGSNIVQTTCLTSAPTYLDSDNDNLHLDPSDTSAKNQGTDLSGDGAFDFDDDIDGETRESGSWDIGFDEYVSAGTTLPQMMYYYNKRRAA
jgi:hypothetical protein